MKNLSTYLESPFDDATITIDQLAAFTTDHLGRLRAQNADGALDDRVAATAAAMQAFDDAYTADMVATARRMGRKQAKRQFRHKLPRETGRLIAIVEAYFGKRSPEIHICLPRGRRGLARSTDDMLEENLGALLKGLQSLEATIGAQWVEMATALRDEWRAIYTESESSTAGQTATADRLRRARRTLQWELYRNLLEIALRYPRQPKKLSLYMMPYLLGKPQDFSGKRPRKRRTGPKPAQQG